MHCLCYLLQTASDALRRNHERNVSDVIQMLPNTLVGIDVNLKFDTYVAPPSSTSNTIND